MTVKAKDRNFKKLSNVEHVRLRTGMWLGQNSPSNYEQHFFIPQKTNEKYLISHEEITEIPAKLKCLDEACMNAVDEYNRNLNDKSISKDKKMNHLEVSLSNDRREVSIADNGRGIPSKNAESVFLHLMYGENFDDELKKDHVAGQNGVGISLVRIVSSYFKAITYHQGKCYSKVFTVTPAFLTILKKHQYDKTEIEEIRNHFDEHGHIEHCSVIKQVHLKNILSIMKKENMVEVVKKSPFTSHSTEVTFRLNEKYFNNLDVSFDLKLMRQYLQDIAMTNPGLKVTLIHQKKKETYQFKRGLEDIFKSFDYPYYKAVFNNRNKNNPIVLETFALDGPGKTLTWVNTNFASLGGSPIEYLINRICDEIRKKPSIIAFEKKLKTMATRSDVRNCFHLYNNWHILNPRFKSQDKSYLINDLNEEIRITVDQHLDKLTRKLDLVNKIKEQMEKRTRLKAIEEASRNLRKANRSNITKFIPPTGRVKDGIKTLFIAEGDSAVAGLRPARNPKYHGLFPLRGKPLNVKGIPLVKAMKNEEIKNIIAILGLPLNEKVKSIEILNFDRISIITDADYDGYAIRSLILSFFFEYWPELYDLGFIYYSSAPLYEVEVVNASKKKKFFYCMDDDEYNELIKKCEKNQDKVVRKKRNKGLGETSKEAMKFTVEHCLTKVTMPSKKKAVNTQNLWFHKDFAKERRKTISEYSQLFFDD